MSALVGLVGALVGAVRNNLHVRASLTGVELDGSAPLLSPLEAEAFAALLVVAAGEVRRMREHDQREVDDRPLLGDRP